MHLAHEHSALVRFCRTWRATNRPLCMHCGRQQSHSCWRRRRRRCRLTGWLERVARCSMGPILCLWRAAAPLSARLKTCNLLNICATSTGLLCRRRARGSIAASQVQQQHSSLANAAVAFHLCWLPSRFFRNASGNAQGRSQWQRSLLTGSLLLLSSLAL